MKYTTPFSIDSDKLSEIQKEILSFVETHRIFNKRGYIIKEPQLEAECPITWNYIKSVSKFRLDSFIPAKLFFTPPNGELLPHVDPSFSPIGLNIPIANTDNTSFTYYETDQSNLVKTEKIGNNGLGHAPVPKDLNLIKEIESVELLQPCLVRTDILHGVKSNNNNTRIILSIRWMSKSKDFNSYH